MAKQLEKLHRGIWKAGAQLEEARDELEKQERERIKDLAAVAAGSKKLAPSDTAIIKAERAVLDADATVTELCRQHREALKERLESAAEKGKGGLEALQEKRQTLIRERAEAAGQAMQKQVELDSLELEIQSALSKTSVIPAPAIIEGTPVEIMAQVQSNAIYAVDPRNLKDTLEDLEAQAKAKGFGGNKVIRKDGKTYYPTAGRCRVEFSPDTGLVKSAQLIYVMAIESVEGALPIDVHNLEPHVRGESVCI